MNRPRPPSDTGGGVPDRPSAVEQALADVLRAASGLHSQRALPVVASALQQLYGQAPVDAALLQLAEADMPEAMLTLGERHKEDDPRAALGWLQRAAALGSTGAIIWLGRAHRDAGRVTEAKTLFNEAAERGDAEALHELARLSLADGDTAKAAELLAASARLGSADRITT